MALNESFCPAICHAKRITELEIFRVFGYVRPCSCLNKDGPQHLLICGDLEVSILWDFLESLTLGDVNIRSSKGHLDALSLFLHVVVKFGLLEVDDGV